MQSSRLRVEVLLVLGALLCSATSAGARELQRREALLERLARARAAALERIFDQATYRDEDHGRSGQKDVDAAVEAVRTAWEPVCALLDAEARKLEKGSGSRRAALLSARPDALSSWERALQQRCRDRQLLARNAAPDPRVAPAEREQVRITNEYRLLMGLPALALEPRLVASARAHSEEMRRLGYFSHTSPTPELRSMQERIARAGIARVPVGENIAKGYATPQAAFEGWYRSPGHHRNMLGAAWARLGAGVEGDLWTQNYAGE